MTGREAGPVCETLKDRVGGLPMAKSRYFIDGTVII